MNSTLPERATMIIGRERFVFICMFLIVPLSSLAIHRSLPVPPTAVLFAAGFLLLVAYTPRISNLPLLLLPVLCVMYFFFSQIIIGAPFTRFTGVVLAIFYYIAVVAFGHRLLPAHQDRLERIFINFSILLLIAECVWRLTHPDEQYKVFGQIGDYRWIYQYKFGSFMYADSNGSAIHILVLLFFIYYRDERGGRVWTLQKIILFALLFLTVSRAAWLAGIVGWIYARFLRKQSLLFFLVLGAFLTLAALAVYFIVLQERLENDLSFQSKFDIARDILKYYSTASLPEILFGIGFSNSLPRMGVYAHNFAAIFLVESGVFGLVFMVLLFLQFLASTGGRALIVLLPFLIATISASLMFIPFFYVVMGLIFLRESRSQHVTLTNGPS